MLPANEGLERGDGPLAQAEDRLVGQHQLLALHSPLQVDLELEALDDRRVHLGLEERVAALAARLRPVHRQVGIPQEGLGRGCARGDPDRDGDEHLAAAQLEGQVERVEDAAGEAGGVARGGDLVDQDRELVAAQAGHRVARPRAFGDPLGDQDQ